MAEHISSELTGGDIGFKPKGKLGMTAVDAIYGVCTPAACNI